MKRTSGLVAIILLLSSCRGEAPSSFTSPQREHDAAAKRQCEQAGKVWKDPAYGPGRCVAPEEPETAVYVDPSWDPDKARKKAQAVRSQGRKGAGKETKEEDPGNAAPSPAYCDINLPTDQFDSCLEDLANNEGYSGVQHNAFTTSYTVCSAFSFEEVAAEYGSASDPISAAQAYSQDFRPEAQQAAFEGCLAAFEAP